LSPKEAKYRDNASGPVTGINFTSVQLGTAPAGKVTVTFPSIEVRDPPPEQMTADTDGGDVPVGVGVGVEVGSGVAVTVGVSVAVGLDVGMNVAVTVLVEDGVDDGVGLDVAVSVAVAV
jgi:hypothetical protein